MVKTELVKQSPLRILDGSTHGGVGKGNLGVITARHGVGKTSALVHLATDKLLQGKGVIHVTFSTRTDHILEYYEEIFTEISKVKSLEGAMQVHDEIIRHRMIMNFDPKSCTLAHIFDSVKARLTDKAFAAETVIVDEYDFAHAKVSDLEAFATFAKDQQLELWFSLSLPDEGSQAGADVPTLLQPFQDAFAVMINLRALADGKVHLELVKDHGNKPKKLPLVLDTKTLLIARD